MNNKRKYYGRDQWKQWILECKDSGLTINEWCNQHGLNKNRFFKWRKKFLEDGTIEYYPMRTVRIRKEEEKKSDEDTQFPAVVQVNLDTLQSEKERGNVPPESSAGRLCQPFTDSQVMVETPVQGFRIHLGTGFDPDVLKKLLEVIH